jgi:hypothetical protein
MDAELFEQIKMLAAKLRKDQNDLLEEAAQDSIRQYENRVFSLQLKPLPNADPGDFSQTKMPGLISSFFNPYPIYLTGCFLYCIVLRYVPPFVHYLCFHWGDALSMGKERGKRVTDTLLHPK